MRGPHRPDPRSVRAVELEARGKAPAGAVRKRTRETKIDKKWRPTPIRIVSSINMCSSVFRLLYFRADDTLDNIEVRSV